MRLRSAITPSSSTKVEINQSGNQPIVLQLKHFEFRAASASVHFLCLLVLTQESAQKH